MNMNKLGKFECLLVFCVLTTLIFALTSQAGTSSKAGPGRAVLKSQGSGGGGGDEMGGSGTVSPDLFTGTMSYSIPIEVAPGRKGMQPNLALTYRSSSGNGWLGVGWDLDIGAIERSTRDGVDYLADDYVLRLAGSSIELVNIGSNIYQAKIEGSFLRIKKNANSWEVTDKVGRKYYFGQTNRQFDPDDSSKVFRWCLDQFVDTSGNSVEFHYWRHQNQLYIDYIDYTHSTSSAPGKTLNLVKFYWEERLDAPGTYATNFYVETAYRLKTVDVWGGGTRLRTYKLDYAPLGSTVTGRSLLSSVQQFGADANVNAGEITNASSASKLPAYSFIQNNSNISGYGINRQGPPLSLGGSDFYAKFDLARLRIGDFNGDGLTDFAWIDGWSSAPPMTIYYTKPDGTGYDLVSGPSMSVNGNFEWGGVDIARVIVGDFNGDGKTDIARINSQGTTDYMSIYYARSDGRGFVEPAVYGPPVWVINDSSGAAVDVARIKLGDFNGDGKTDIARIPGWGSGNPSELIVYYANTNGIGFTQSPVSGPSLGVTNDNEGALLDISRVIIADFNGDGKDDVAYINGYDSTAHAMSIYYANANTPGFTAAFPGPPVTVYNTLPPRASYDISRVKIGDFNGDGKVDIAIVNGWDTTEAMTIYLSKGFGFAAPIAGPAFTVSSYFGGAYVDGITRVLIADFNGDGMSDIAHLEGQSSDAPLAIYYSTGHGFLSTPFYGPTLPTAFGDGLDAMRLKIGNFNGDRLADIVRVSSFGNSQPVDMYLSSGVEPDLVKNIVTPFAGSFDIVYRSSDYYDNLSLPFILQTVSVVKACDNPSCDGTSSTTRYSYSGGFFHIGSSELRGFNSVEMTGPAGPQNEQLITKTWFHQGNETAVVDVDDPLGIEGYMKGKPYRTIVTNEQGTKLSEVTTAYSEDSSEPYFNPPFQVDSYVCNGACGIHTRMTYSYDSYGNATLENFYDVATNSTPYRFVQRSFTSNDSDWIVGLPLTENIFSGATGTKISGVEYYYDGGTNCTSYPHYTDPTKGNLTSVVKWNNMGDSPETLMAYDEYGNVSCTRDANENTPSTVSYDGTFTFPRVATNPLGHQTITEYYGVDDVPADNGLYGQVKSVIDPNLQITTMVYDSLGRKSSVTTPDGSWTSWEYNNFGDPVNQHIKRTSKDTNTQDNNGGLVSLTYFDGLGRTYLKKTDGPSNKIIVTDTVYNATGTVNETSLPHFENDSSDGARYITYKYDAQGRVTEVTNSDQTKIKTCYDTGVSAGIDANGHKKVERRDSLGRLIQVEEYRDTYASCSTTDGTIYATTIYQYSEMGNLTTVIDASNNHSIMTYDSLGRKRSMQDPDMGYWTYTYYPNGNLLTQTDPDGEAKKITFYYDALNRVTRKDYADSLMSDVIYSYDETENSKGRLTTMADGSGFTKYYYDAMGRTKTVTQNLNNNNYTIQYEYDDLGRLKKLTYPDTDNDPNNDIVQYSYDTGGNLYQVFSQSTSSVYAAYTDYTALSQPRNVAFANGLVTDYTYTLSNSRLNSIVTGKSGQPALLDLTYGYDDVGNVTTITDNATREHQPDHNYDEVVTYSHLTDGNTRPHAVSASEGIIYGYDSRGNMTSDGMRTINYNTDNMPTSMTINNVSTNFTYDGAGARVAKTKSGYTQIYIGKLYTCNAEECMQNIFAGSTRIAQKVAGTDNIIYFHPDHLGSTSIVTNATGSVTENIQYFPFGETRQDYVPLNGGDPTSYKYTSQEFDAETSLYYYNARYYNPVMGRFISADTIVPDPRNPQAFNRYSYVQNNPLRYVDPEGHFLMAPIIIGLAIGAVSAGAQSDWNADAMVRGAGTGAVSGLVGSWGYGLVANSIGGIGGGALGGAMSGSVSAALNGGNLGQAALWGAIGGAVFSGIGKSEMNGFGKTVTSAAAGGFLSEASGGRFETGFITAGAVSGLANAALYMREQMIISSLQDDRNWHGVSDGLFGDLFKLAGGRWVEDLLPRQQECSKLGCLQGGPGKLFGVPYAPGSMEDHLLEVYAGPHDYLNSRYWYNPNTGNAYNYTGIKAAVGAVLNWGNVLLATPFAAASVTPSYMYPIMFK